MRLSVKKGARTRSTPLHRKSGGAEWRDLQFASSHADSKAHCFFHRERPDLKSCPDTKQEFSSSLLIRRLWPRKIHHDHIGALDRSFESNLATVRGDVEVARIEVWREVCQLPLLAGLQIDEPEVLVLHVSP
jgi:hypothetical protein